eukprot:PhF_6_TR26989/c0_g1_i1/m.39387
MAVEGLLKQVAHYEALYEWIRSRTISTMQERTLWLTSTGPGVVLNLPGIQESQSFVQSCSTLIRKLDECSKKGIASNVHSDDIDTTESVADRFISRLESNAVLSGPPRYIRASEELMLLKELMEIKPLTSEAIEAALENLKRGKLTFSARTARMNEILKERISPTIKTLKIALRKLRESFLMNQRMLSRDFKDAITKMKEIPKVLSKEWHEITRNRSTSIYSPAIPRRKSSNTSDTFRSPSATVQDPSAPPVFNLSDESLFDTSSGEKIGVGLGKEQKSTAVHFSIPQPITEPKVSSDSFPVGAPMLSPKSTKRVSVREIPKDTRELLEQEILKNSQPSSNVPSRVGSQNELNSLKVITGDGVVGGTGVPVKSPVHSLAGGLRRTSIQVTMDATRKVSQTVGTTDTVMRPAPPSTTSPKTKRHSSIDQKFIAFPTI